MTLTVENINNQRRLHQCHLSAKYNTLTKFAYYVTRVRDSLSHRGEAYRLLRKLFGPKGVEVIDE